MPKVTKTKSRKTTLKDLNHNVMKTIFDKLGYENAKAARLATKDFWFLH